MIAIKTTMRRIPACCQQCKLYINGKMYGEGSCGAMFSKDGFPRSLFDVTITKKRASFCPLVEIRDGGKRDGKEN